MEFKRDMDDVLRPGMENKYVYQNIESEYYRKSMQRLAYVYFFFFNIPHTISYILILFLITGLGKFQTPQIKKM